MNKELKAKWIAALGSGDYQQGFYAFKPTADTYCCLGVLCEVLGRTDLISYCHDDYNSLRKASGLNASQTDTLTAMNDNLTYHTFAMIADYIEESIPAV